MSKYLLFFACLLFIFFAIGGLPAMHRAEARLDQVTNLHLTGQR